MNKSFTSYPFVDDLEKVFVFFQRKRVSHIHGAQTQRVSKVNREKANVYSIGPTNEDKIVSTSPYSPNTFIYRTIKKGEHNEQNQH